MEYDRQGMGRVWPEVYLQRYTSDFSGFDFIVWGHLDSIVPNEDTLNRY